LFRWFFDDSHRTLSASQLNVGGLSLLEPFPSDVLITVHSDKPKYLEADQTFWCHGIDNGCHGAPGSAYQRPRFVRRCCAKAKADEDKQAKGQNRLQ
jgi:hypothetical protein